LQAFQFIKTLSYYLCTDPLHQVMMMMMDAMQKIVIHTFYLGDKDSGTKETSKPVHPFLLNLIVG
jgi:hypothetical protein